MSPDWNPRARPRRVKTKHYGSEQFQRLMAVRGVTCSLSRSGDVWNHAAMESFVSSLATGRIRGRICDPRERAGGDEFDAIERFDKPKRQHPTISCLGHLEFEEMANTSSIPRASNRPNAT